MLRVLKIFTSKNTTLSSLFCLLCFILTAIVFSYNFEHTNISRLNKLRLLVTKSNISNTEERSRNEDRDDISNICTTKLFRTEKMFNNMESYIPSYFRKVTNECYTEDSSVKYILSLHNIWGIMTKELEKSMFDGCPVKKCVVTQNRTLKPIDQFDAVVFDLLYRTKIEKRSPHQQYVFLNLETPFITNYGSYPSPKFFNLSVCYRRDSDILYPYALVKKKKTGYVLPSVDKIKNKTKMAAWFVSNCGKKRREKYVAELQKYIPVDVYGRCGTLKCQKILPYDNNDRDGPCYQMIGDEYMFYMSFENANCYDYATEKMYNIFHYDTIPVVLGGAHYDSMVPKNSVIKVSDFPSPKALAAYLIKVSQDPQLYLSYLEWKKDYAILGEPHRTRFVFCQLCDLLHRSFVRSSYESIEAWQRGENCEL